MMQICVGDGACGVEENGRRRREREWGKKKERIDEEEWAGGLCITQGHQPRWGPWCTTERREAGAPPGGTWGPGQGSQA
jgi:hypothetical protein